MALKSGQSGSAMFPNQPGQLDFTREYTKSTGESFNLHYTYIYMLYVNRIIPVPDVTNSFPEHLAFVFASVSMAAAEAQLIFLDMGT